MKKEYDKTIDLHYRDEAIKHGPSPLSTMPDEITRHLETAAIVEFVGGILRSRNKPHTSDTAVIMDVGCGNGYTLDVLSNTYPDADFLGIERSDELRAIASSRCKERKNIRILAADIRDNGFAQGLTADILICQRVLINILDKDDQKLALQNIIRQVRSPGDSRPGGALLFIECFKGPLENLNRARGEFDLDSIPPAYHNLYLADDFFAVPQLRALNATGPMLRPNFLSTHYYAARVLHPLFTRDKPFKRNSEFVRFFTEALHSNVGDYSPLKVYTFGKVGDV